MAIWTAYKINFSYVFQLQYVASMFVGVILAVVDADHQNACRQKQNDVESCCYRRCGEFAFSNSPLKCPCVARLHSVVSANSVLMHLRQATIVTAVYLVLLDLFFKHTAAITLKSDGVDIDILAKALMLVPSQVCWLLHGTHTCEL